ncbi:hypothetical protein GRJ2_002593100 [Grus japonensis]|uniref:Uncharacterized protein n=1 Tax=Grus japonensis TaxID=30415 RepID=A0ABC9XU54_GRUJA
MMQTEKMHTKEQHRRRVECSITRCEAGYRPHRIWTREVTRARWGARTAAQNDGGQVPQGASEGRSCVPMSGLRRCGQARCTAKSSTGGEQCRKKMPSDKLCVKGHRKRREERRTKAGRRPTSADRCVGDSA